jgi:hypothetical protein
VFILDSLLIDGLGFVFDKIRVAADAERDDDSHLREALAEGQARLEAGELSESEYAELERDILSRLAAIRRRRTGAVDGPIEARVTGADVEIAVPESVSLVEGQPPAAGNTSPRAARKTRARPARRQPRRV